MADLQVLSTAANAFAVVGLADVVFRASTELYNLFDRCKAAPRTISQLLSELKSLASIVATVRVFADEFQASPYALEDQQVLLPQLETILRDIERDFGELKTLAITSQSNTNDAWFKQWGKNSSWSLNEQKALRACQQLERHKTALNVALSVIGRRNDIVIRNELKATRTDITDACAAAETKFQDVQQHVASSNFNLKMLTILIDKGADVHVVDFLGLTALHGLLTPFALRLKKYKAYDHRDVL
ncbi:hypothetical protein B0A49_10775, partial [Cryomyces minteri]